MNATTCLQGGASGRGYASKLLRPQMRQAGCWRPTSRPMEAPAKRAATTLGSGRWITAGALTVFQAQLNMPTRNRTRNRSRRPRGTAPCACPTWGDGAINRIGAVRKMVLRISIPAAALTLAKSLRALSAPTARLTRSHPSRLLGGDHGVTLELNSNFVRAMCMDPNAPHREGCGHLRTRRRGVASLRRRPERRSCVVGRRAGRRTGP